MLIRNLPSQREQTTHMPQTQKKLYIPNSLCRLFQEIDVLQISEPENVPAWHCEEDSNPENESFSCNTL